MKRVVAVTIAAVVLVGFAVGSGGSLQVTGSKTVAIGIVSDEMGYVGFEQTTLEEDGNVTLTVSISNQFPAGTTLTTVDVEVGGQTEDLADAGPLYPGETGSVTVESVDCSDTISVEIIGEDVDVDFSRDIRCPS